MLALSIYEGAVTMSFAISRRCLLPTRRGERSHLPHSAMNRFASCIFPRYAFSDGPLISQRP